MMLLYIETSFEKYRTDCQKITYYYIEERYPLHGTSDLTHEELKNSFESAQKLIDEILNLTNN